MKEITCLRCGHKWWSRVETPAQCPGCKSYRYNIPKREVKTKEVKTKEIKTKEVMVLIDRHMTIKNFETRCVNMKAWARQHGINYDNLYATLTRAAPLKMTEKQLYMIEKLKEDGLYEEAR